ncbi:integrase catalytic domain-containing protein [Trichonephila clavipes]|nr:integrase catalytic domain-containing protein [Trichonephila clavipes]
MQRKSGRTSTKNYLEKRAYAAVVYIKCFNESGQSQTRLLCSKSRVAPLKTLTIPRLELSAALLLSKLVKKVVPILQLPIHKIWMWTDSTIDLVWIKTEHHELKKFVSNRVVEIQTLSKDCHWKHVSSKNNPADFISRGCNVAEKQVAFRKNNVAVGCLVLLKENDLPPCKWGMARILEVIYGTHGSEATGDGTCNFEPQPSDEDDG